jgi:hypothetical protein
MTMLAAPDGILENVNCDCKPGCSTRCCACQKTELKCTGLCSCCDCTNSPDQNTDHAERLDGDETGFNGIFEEQ